MNRLLGNGSILAGILALLASCATDSDRVAGGSGTEAGETYGFVLRSDGAPVPHHPVEARYQVRPLAAARVVDTLWTDSSGRFEIAGPAGIYRFLSTEDSLIALSPPVRMVVDSTIAAGTMALSPAREVHGVVRSTSGVFPSGLELEGSAFPCAWTSEGGAVRTFSCTGLAEGSYQVIGGRSWLGSFQVGKDSAWSLPDTFQYEPGIVHLETWPEVGLGTYEARRHDLWGLTGSGGWIVVTDGVSNMSPSRTADIEHSIFRDTAAGRNYLKVDYVLDTAFDRPWVQLNVRIGADAYDLSSLDSVCFVHRGNSKVVVQISRQSGNPAVVASAPPVDSRIEWTRTCLALEEWTDSGPDAGDATRELVRSANALRFRPSGGTAWDLSTIDLVGLDLPSIFR
ncbi:MAG: hypothetical protein H6686_03880 [Fibrobacteria bacterium]|nr:hypothetical protein [Fibrobacteria bacterium]